MYHCLIYSCNGSRMETPKIDFDIKIFSVIPYFYLFFGSGGALWKNTSPVSRHICFAVEIGPDITSKLAGGRRGFWLGLAMNQNTKREKITRIWGRKTVKGIKNVGMLARENRDEETAILRLHVWDCPLSVASYMMRVEAQKRKICRRAGDRCMTKFAM